ncbi:MAG: acyltransferase family protein [Flavobacteriaceae bacterium]|jgi:surface polysaccharide O-acyltransferase-like enzyme|nr:acyltransferase family protein [Flavobacteriaceae bacterium]
MKSKMIENQTDKTQKERNLSIDILKLILSFLVVGMHGSIFSDFSPFLSYIFVHGLARIAVPIFLIISGFYFFEIQTKKQFQKWIKRLFLLYLIWMVVYFKFWFSLNYKITLENLIFGYWHLWYLIGAVEAFVLLWCIRNLKFQYLLFIAILCAFSGLFLQYNRNYNFTEIFNPLYKFESAYRNGLFLCFPFVVTGYFINKYKITKRYKNWTVLLLASVFLLIVEACFNYTHGKKGFDILFSLYFLCPLLFLYTSNLKYYSKRKTLSMYSTGIYLTHIFVLRFLKFTVLSRTPAVIATILLSTLLTYFLVKIQQRFKYIL